MARRPNQPLLPSRGGRLSPPPSGCGDAFVHGATNRPSAIGNVPKVLGTGVQARQESGRKPMCGRYPLKARPEAIADAFDLPEVPLIEPRYNIAPTQPVPVIRL